jgi:integrase
MRDSDVRAATRLREERIREAKNHRAGIRKFQGPAAEKVTVNDLLDELVAYATTAGLKSLRQMKVHIEPVRSFFGYRRAVELARKPIEKFIEWRRENDAADATIDRELELLRRAYTLAREDGRIAFMPPVPRLVKGHANARQGFVERAELEKLLPELPSQVLRDVALFAYATGMRKSEILSLTWDGFDRETKMLRLHASKAKTGRGRAVSLEGWPELAQVVERRLAERRLDCSLIFHNGRGARVGDFYTSWERALDRAKLRHFTIHDFRRTAVRNMVRAGVPESVAMSISGHRTRAIFDRYNITSEKDLAEAMAKRAAYEASLPKKA